MNMSPCKESKQGGFLSPSPPPTSPGVDTEGYSLYWRAGPRSSLGRVGGFLLCILSVSLAAAQRALCHLTNLKSWPQVAHRSQSRRRRRRGREGKGRRKCAPHASPPERKSISPSVWTARNSACSARCRSCQWRQTTGRRRWLGLGRQRGRFSRKISGKNVGAARRWRRREGMRQTNIGLWKRRGWQPGGGGNPFSADVAEMKGACRLKRCREITVQRVELKLCFQSEGSQFGTQRETLD